MSTEIIQRYRNVNEKQASVAFLCHQFNCVWAFVIGNGTRTQVFHLWATLGALRCALLF